MLPQVGPLQQMKDIEIDPKHLARVEAIINSMTYRERLKHEIINGRRRRRIAKGSGTSVQEVNQLLRQYRQARQMMKSLSGGLRKKKKRFGNMNLDALLKQQLR